MFRLTNWQEREESQLEPCGASQPSSRLLLFLAGSRGSGNGEGEEGCAPARPNNAAAVAL